VTAPVRRFFGSWSPAHWAFLGICALGEVALLAFDRQTAYLAVGAAAYGLVLWIVTRSCIRLDLPSEETAFKTRPGGWRLWARVAVVVAACAYVLAGREVFWSGPVNAALQHLSVIVGLRYGDSALPNVLLRRSCPARFCSYSARRLRSSV
jgi:hypothetical protein